MADTARVIAVLEEWEGRENDKYNDHLGHPTIGVGHKMTTPVRPPAYALVTGEEVDVKTPLPSSTTSIYDDAVDEIRDNDIEDATHNALYYICQGGSPSRWHVLSHVRQEVLINMAFQLGRAGLGGFSETRTHILAGEWEEAHNEMLRSKWAEEDTPTRANKMADAMHTNDASYLYKY